MTGIETLRTWIEKLGYTASPHDGSTSTLRLAPRDAELADLPPFFLQVSEHWVLLSILPLFGPEAHLPDDIAQRLLAMNRDMRTAKLALGEDDEFVLCAELPTESLDYSELEQATKRMIQYARECRARFTSA